MLKSEHERCKINSAKEYLDRMKPNNNIAASDVGVGGGNTDAGNTNAGIGTQSPYYLAWQTACDIRKFEIEMYWKRATYFWAFIVSVYTAFFYVLSIDMQKAENLLVRGDWFQVIALVVLAFLGFCFCLGFLLQNIGSKQWQKNWETHVDLLEDSVVGPLYKTFVQEPKKNFSVTKINEKLCVCLVVVSILISGYSIYLLCAKSDKPFVSIGVPIVSAIVELALFIGGCNGMLGFLKGNKIKEKSRNIEKGEIPFVKREYKYTNN